MSGGNKGLSPWHVLGFIIHLDQTNKNFVKVRRVEVVNKYNPNTVVLDTNFNIWGWDERTKTSFELSNEDLKRLVDTTLGVDKR